jgi:hypothetical protein
MIHGDGRTMGHAPVTLFTIALGNPPLIRTRHRTHPMPTAQNVQNIRVRKEPFHLVSGQNGVIRMSCYSTSNRRS